MQARMDASIAAHADSEVLYDQLESHWVRRPSKKEVFPEDGSHSPQNQRSA
jgi:hypothetical protein